jgi:hypothetical protein
LVVGRQACPRLLGECFHLLDLAAPPRDAGAQQWDIRRHIR